MYAKDLEIYREKYQADWLDRQVFWIFAPLYQEVECKGYFDFVLRYNPFFPLFYLVWLLRLICRMKRLVKGVM